MSSQASMTGMSGMSMAVSSAMPDMPMNMSTSTAVAMNTGMAMNNGGMDMVFFSAINTSLFSAEWTPSTTGQFAGTCVFLVALTVTFRGLLALRNCLESGTWSHIGPPLLGHSHPKEEDETGADSTPPLSGVRSAWSRRPPWQLRIDGWRAVLDTILVGVGYLLMLAVMTMNVGYFASILGGTFLGSLALGRFTRGGTAC